MLVIVMSFGSIGFMMFPNEPVKNPPPPYIATVVLSAKRRNGKINQSEVIAILLKRECRGRKVKPTEWCEIRLSIAISCPERIKANHRSMS